MAQILDLMARESKPISEIVGRLPKLVMVKDKMTLPAAKLAAALKKVEERYTKQKETVQALKLDGLRLDWSDRWLLLRGSNTEPIVRLIAEASSAEVAKALIDDAKQFILGL